MNVKDLTVAFEQYFHHSNFRIFFVAGHNQEINELPKKYVVEEHPPTQHFGTYVLTATTNTNRIRLVSLNFEELGVIEFSLTELDDEIRHDWTNYLKRTIRYLKEAGYSINQGMDLIIYGNIPNEVGLSSSASIEALTAVIIKSLY